MNVFKLTKRAKDVWKILQHSQPQDFTMYSTHFSELSFMQKIGRVGEYLGDTLLLPILKLYYILRSPEVSLKAKLYITGALGYFILPIDFIPDFIPGLLGFSDDLIVVGIILKQVSTYATPEITAKAEALLRKVCPLRH